MNIEEIHKIFLQTSGVTTDTRNLLQDGLFFAIKGANFDGNAYAEQALKEGCKYAIVDNPDLEGKKNCIYVDDTLTTLQKLANYHRKTFDIPVIGITGSNGKTTTKELLGAVLSKKYNALVTSGNLNNHLGVPFTLLKLTKEHELAIIEMGANKPGDIKELVEIAEPTHGIITNIGAAHLEGFGSLEGVVRTKTELYKFIEQTDGFVFYHKEDQRLIDHLPSVQAKASYGERLGDITGDLVEQNPFVCLQWKEKEYTSPVVQTNLVGKFNFINFLAAICIGRHFEVSPDQINEAIENYHPTNNRSQIQKSSKNTIIVDCYNANVTSMNAALSSFVEMNVPEKVAILGDMLELGEYAMDEHQRVVDFLKENELAAILVGSEMGKVDTQNYPHFETVNELMQSEILNVLKDKLILLKGSRGIQLEKLLNIL